MVPVATNINMEVDPQENFSFPLGLSAPVRRTPLEKQLLYRTSVPFAVQRAGAHHFVHQYAVW